MEVSSSPNSTCNKSFSSDYMLLNPEDASLLDIFKILFSSNVANRKFIDCPSEEQHEPFSRRFWLFVSILAQKVLQSNAGSIAKFGDGVENWVNLLASNGGFFRLIWNSIRGRVVHPDKNSASFLSFTGHSDRRIDLDTKTMNSGEIQYHILLSLMTAKAAYENKPYIESLVNEHWEMNLVGYYDLWDDYQQKAATQAFIMDDKKDLIVVAFRGTEPFTAVDWISDFDLSWYELPGVGKVHGGFMKALGLQKSQGWPKEQDENKPEAAYYALRRLLKEQLEKNDKARFIVTGHSLGGALAALFPAVLGMHEESWLLERLAGVYTYGQPRVGDHEFAKFVANIIDKYSLNWYRFVYAFDLVPRLPFDTKTSLFKHYGTCIYYNPFYGARIVEEEVNKNYFSILWLIPKTINSVWEMIRGFIMPWYKGSHYRETGVMSFLRMNGLLTMSGLPNHYFHDYHNATILGLSEVFAATADTNGYKPLKAQ